MNQKPLFRVKLKWIVNSNIVNTEIRNNELQQLHANPSCFPRLGTDTDLNYWIKHPFEFSDPILKPEY